jgi:hypothetical protein
MTGSESCRHISMMYKMYVAMPRFDDADTPLEVVLKSRHSAIKPLR